MRNTFRRFIRVFLLVPVASINVAGCRAPYRFEVPKSAPPIQPIAMGVVGFKPSIEDLVGGQLTLPSPLGLEFRRLSLVPPLAPTYQAGMGAWQRSRWGRGWVAARRVMTLKPAGPDQVQVLETEFGNFKPVTGSSSGEFKSANSALVLYRNGSAISLAQGDSTWTYETTDSCESRPCRFYLKEIKAGVEKLEFRRDGVYGLIASDEVERIVLSERPSPRDPYFPIVREVTRDSYDRKAERWVSTARFVLSHDDRELLRSVEVFEGSTSLRKWSFNYYPAPALQERNADVELNRFLGATGLGWSQLLPGAMPSLRLGDFDGDGRLDAAHDGSWYAKSSEEYAEKHALTPNLACGATRPFTLLVLPGIDGGKPVRLSLEQTDLSRMRITVCPAVAGPPIATQDLQAPLGVSNLLGGWRSSINPLHPEPIRAQATAHDVDGDGKTELVLMTVAGFIATELTGNAAAPFSTFKHSSQVGPLKDGRQHSLDDVNVDGSLDIVEYAPADGYFRVWYGTRSPLIFSGPASVSVPAVVGHCSDSLASWDPLEIQPDLVRFCETPTFGALMTIYGYDAGAGYSRVKMMKQGTALMLPAALLPRGAGFAVSWLAFQLRQPDLYGRCPDGSSARNVEPKCPPSYEAMLEISPGSERAGLLESIDDGLGTELAVAYDWSVRAPGKSVSRPYPARYEMRTGNSNVVETVVCPAQPIDTDFGTGRGYAKVVVYTGPITAPRRSCEDPRSESLSETEIYDFHVERERARPLSIVKRRRSVGESTHFHWDPTPEAPSRLLSEVAKVSLGGEDRVVSTVRYGYANAQSATPATVELERGGQRLITRRKGADDVTVEGRHSDPAFDFKFRLFTERERGEETRWLEEGCRRRRLQDLEWDRHGRLLEMRAAGEPATVLEYEGDDRLPSSIASRFGKTSLRWDPAWDYLKRLSWGKGATAAVVDVTRKGTAHSSVSVQGDGDRVVTDTELRVDASQGLLRRSVATRAGATLLSTSSRVSLLDGSASVLLNNSCGSAASPQCVVASMRADSAASSLNFRGAETDEVTGGVTTWAELSAVANRSSSIAMQQNGLGANWSTFSGVPLSGENRWLLGEGNSFKEWHLRSNKYVSESNRDAGGLSWNFKSIDGAGQHVQRDALGRIVRISLTNGEVRSYRYDSFGMASATVQRRAVDGPSLTIRRLLDDKTLRVKERLVAAGEIQWKDTFRYEEAGGRVDSTSSMGSSVTYQYRYGEPRLGQPVVASVKGPGYEQSFEHDALARGKRRLTTISLAAGKATLDERYQYFPDGRLRSQTVTSRAPGRADETAFIEYRLNERGDVGAVAINGATATIARSKLSLSVASAGEVLAMEWLPDGRIRRVNQTGLGGTIRSFAMQPSSVNGLADKESWSVGDVKREVSYAYSKGDSLLTSVTGNGVTTTFELDPFGRIQSRPLGTGKLLLQRTAGKVELGTHRWQLNDLGVPISIDGVATALDARGRIVADGRGGRYVYDQGDRLVAIETASNAWWRADSISASTAEGLRVPVFIDGKQVGSVVGGKLVLQVTDSRGNSVSSPAVDPFGFGRQFTVGEETLHGRAMPGVAMVQLGERPYDPALGQFARPDIWSVENPEHCAADAQGCDLLAYGGGDPANYVDPSGARRVRVWSRECRVYGDKHEGVPVPMFEWCDWSYRDYDFPDANYPSASDGGISGGENFGGPFGRGGGTSGGDDGGDPPECEKWACGTPINVDTRHWSKRIPVGPMPGYLPGARPGNMPVTASAAYLHRAGSLIGGLWEVTSFLIPLGGPSGEAARIGTRLERVTHLTGHLERIRDAAYQAVKESGLPREHAAAFGNAVDDAFKAMASTDDAVSHLWYARRGQRGPDVYAEGLQVWWDVTTQRAWRKHWSDYTPSWGHGVPLTY
jgi:hypothetical protein